MPLLEFVVLGSSVPYHTKDKVNLKAWKKSITDEAAKNWTLAPLTQKLKMTVINFHEGDVPPLDDDSMVKPIRDAMNKLVYEDDRQITYSEIIQIGIDAPIKIRRGSKILLDAYSTGPEFLYVRVEDAPDFISAVREVPKLQETGPACRQSGSIRREGDSMNPSFRKIDDRPALGRICRQIPKHKGPIRTSGGKGFAVG
jgi:hypothetical protein